MLLDWVQNGGKPVIDKDGKALLDDDGNPRRKPLSGSELEVIRKRINDARAEQQGTPGYAGGDALGNLIARHGGRYQSDQASEDDDDTSPNAEAS